jgi:hypothetical protein
LRRKVDLANRAIRCGIIGLHAQIGKEVSNGKPCGIDNDQSALGMRVAAMRGGSLALLIGTTGILVLLLSRALNKPRMFGEAEHRLRKKDENRAKAQGKQSIFAGFRHGWSVLSQGSKLVK